MAPIGPFSTKGSLSRWDVPDVFLFQGRSEPCRDSKLAMHGFSNIEYESEKQKQKIIEKYQRFTRLNGEKREKFRRMKSTGESVAVKRF